MKFWTIPKKVAFTVVLALAVIVMLLVLWM